MTEAEAIKELQYHVDSPFGILVSEETCKLAINALEKQIAKKPENICRDTGLFDCPVCHRRQVILYQGYHCKECGQRLDWADSEV